MRQKSILFSSRVKTFQAGIYNAGINSVFKGTKAQSASLHGAPDFNKCFHVLALAHV